jgi:hypothetical protein
MNDHVQSGNDPVELAQMVLKIIETRDPKVHYTVGSFMQKFSVILKRLLPGKVYEKILLNHHHLE